MSANKKEKIAIANIKQYGAVPVCYVGGSMFEMDLSQQVEKPIRFNLQALETLISKGQAAVVNKERFAQIKASILPDGSTKTHNADGTEKSTEAQTLEQLVREGYVDPPAGGSVSMRNVQHKHEMRANTSASPVQRGRGQRPNQSRVPISGAPTNGMPSNAFPAGGMAGAPVGMPVGDMQSKQHIAAPKKRVNPTRVKGTAAIAKLDEEPPTPVPDMQGEYEQDASSRLEHDDDFSDAATMPEGYAPADDRRGRAERKRRMQGDLNGDGIVDEFDGFIAEEQRKNGLVMAALTISIVLSVFLFFFAHTLTASIMHGESFDLFPFDNGGQSQSDPNANANQGQGDDNGEGASIENDGTITGTEIIDPAYDPETSVSSYPLADDEVLKAATNYMKNLKSFFISGPMNKPDGAPYVLSDFMDVDTVCNQIADAYVEVAKIRGNIPPENLVELRNEYFANLKTIETENGAMTDAYGSIFCGRLREVRVDPTDSEKIYLVTQAGSGDLQRICFEATCKKKRDAYGQVQYDDNGPIYDIAITGVRDAQGYTNMIADGQ